MPRTHRVLGSVGDVNPLDYGGGIVFIHAQTGKPEIEWTEGLDGLARQVDADDPRKIKKIALTVYRVPVPDDVVDYYDWADWKSIANQYEGPNGTRLTRKAMEIRGQSNDPMQRAHIVIDLAQYEGWHNLDSEPAHIEYGELERAWFPRGKLAKKV